jgi:hypothetical protein
LYLILIVLLILICQIATNLLYDEVNKLFHPFSIFQKTPIADKALGANIKAIVLNFSGQFCKCLRLKHTHYGSISVQNFADILTTKARA